MNNIVSRHLSSGLRLSLRLKWNSSLPQFPCAPSSSGTLNLSKASSNRSNRQFSSVAAAEVPAPTPESEEKQFSPKITAIVDEIASLTLVEVADLNDALKQRLNLPDAPVMGAGMVMAAAPGVAAPGGAQAAAPAEDVVPDKVNFSVILQALADDSNKITLIKEIKKVVPGLNLVQAKKFVESLPATVKDDIAQNEADELKKQLEAAGGKVEVK